jgi:uncharacterized protein
VALTDELRELLEPVAEVRLAVLFGSHARGRATKRSDVDVCVTVQPDTLEARERVRQALWGRVPPADLVFGSQAPPLLRMEIARHGQVVLEREPHAWANFKAKAMIDWGDWAPYARRMGAAAVRRLREELSRGPA